MLKIVFRKCAGIDVHSAQITICIAITDTNDITSYETKIFKTFTQDLKECREWLILKDITDVFTNKYWIPVYNNFIVLLPILNMLELFLTKKLTKKMLNELLICLNTD